MIVRGRVGAERQMVLLRRMAQVVEDCPRLHAGSTPRRVDLEDIVEIFRKIHDHSDVTALARQTGAAAAGQDRCAVTACCRHGLQHIIDRAGNDGTDGRLPVIRAVGGVQGSAAVVGPHFTANVPAQLGLQPLGIDVCGVHLLRGARSALSQLRVMPLFKGRPCKDIGISSVWLLRPSLHLFHPFRPLRRPQPRSQRVALGVRSLEHEAHSRA